MKILLINPRDLSYKPRNGAFARHVSYPAVTLSTLAALVPEELNAEIEILDEGVDETPIDFSVDVMGITATTASVSRAYEIASIARKRGIYVVMGGTHVSYCQEEAAKHADTIIQGLAEESWPRFLRDWSKGDPKSLYKSTNTADISMCPRPRSDLLKLDSYMNVTAVMATRGCPNRCKFCIPSRFAGPKIQTRPTGAVIDEIRSSKSSRVLFLDSNFVADKPYAEELMSALIPLNVRWACLAPIKLGDDPKFLSLMKESGCLGSLIGFESVCQATLNEENKRHNRVEDYYRLISQFHRFGLAVFGCFIFGFDNDTVDIFEQTLQFVKNSRMDLVRFAVLTPFPGTPLYKSLQNQGRIVEQNYDLYDFQHVVHQPLNMTQKELQNGLVHSWRKAYSFGNIVNRVLHAKASLPLVLGTNIAFTRYYKKLIAAG